MTTKEKDNNIMLIVTREKKSHMFNGSGYITLDKNKEKCHIHIEERRQIQP
jgi:hypothetical protein